MRKAVPATQADALIVQRIRDGESEAWNDLIARFEGRLQAFVESRTGDRASAEDVVQETFIGFLTSLPNYDGHQSLEGYLFAIAAHKLIDCLRRQGRRPALPLIPGGSDSSGSDPCAGGRRASSLVRSSERRHLEESAIASALAEQIEHCHKDGRWERLKCMELLLVRGYANKDAAVKLGISEKAVASYKFEFLEQLRAAVRTQNLPAAVFPELYVRND